jgi:hypothetical protein
MFFSKVEDVPDGVLGGYCYGMGVVQSTQRVLLEELRDGHVLLTMVLLEQIK